MDPLPRPVVELLPTVQISSKRSPTYGGASGGTSLSRQIGTGGEMPRSVKLVLSTPAAHAQRQHPRSTVY
jgi:hypothetical protein